MTAVTFHSYAPDRKREIVDHVLAQLSTGRSVSRILQEDDGMVSADTWWRWLRTDPQLSEEVERARAQGIEAHLDVVIDIVDDASDDAEIIWKEGVAIGAKVNGTAIRRASLQAEMRLKMAQMLQPKKYGTKVDLTSGGEPLKANTHIGDNKLTALIGIAQSRKAAGVLPKETDDEIDPFS